jgi:hypothetical protein
VNYQFIKDPCVKVGARLSVSLLANFVLHENPKTTLVQWQVGNMLQFYCSNICYGVIRVHINNTPCRFCGNVFLWGKKMKKNSNCTFYGLMKIWFNFDHWKVQNYHLAKIFMGRILDLSLSSHIISYIESLYNTFRMEINTYIF